MIFATALDRDDLTRQRIARLVQQTTFSTAEREMLLLDWKAYRKRQNQLWQWYRQAQIANRPAAYLQRIIAVAICRRQHFVVSPERKPGQSRTGSPIVKVCRP